MNLSSPKYIILLSVLTVFLGCTTMSEPSEKRPYHHTDKGFRNLYVTIDKGLTEVFKMRFGGDTEWVNPTLEAAQVPRAKQKPPASIPQWKTSPNLPGSVILPSLFSIEASLSSQTRYSLSERHR